MVLDASEMVTGCRSYQAVGMVAVERIDYPLMVRLEVVDCPAVEKAVVDSQEVVEVDSREVVEALRTVQEEGVVLTSASALAVSGGGGIDQGCLVLAA